MLIAKKKYFVNAETYIMVLFLIATDVTVQITCIPGLRKQLDALEQERKGTLTDYCKFWELMS